MIAWAARIKNRPIEDLEIEEAFMIALLRLEKEKMDISYVTYPASVPKMMVVTRYGEAWNWRKGDDPMTMPQFKMGKKEERVRQALEKEGIKGLEFVTSYGLL
ncbi:hypothetical protein Hypma_012237 [Hypsizygus marmoreus]|uniref:Uncharacterized protein n=1 Tax=Hypsizygus marmoreus TaxID=39966 RepID=A0A369JEL1_HYPMA|nr:hypothetical protein Hypma_012237 [Hypsizygus marmoreus]